MAFTPSTHDAPAFDDEVVDFIGARVFEPVQIPRTPYKGVMRLVSRKELRAIKAAARKALLADGFKLDAPGAHGGEEWDNELAVRILAVAIRNPRQPTLELAALPEWDELDDDQIDKLWRDYLDFAARIDPLGSKPDLSDADIAAVTAAAKKKDVTLLMGFGSRKLALFALRSLTAPPTS